MGFGKKTDFETGRVLDLNASYENVIKPAVTQAGYECIRADEIIHSGLIDDPMYRHLLDADVVVADLSTSNRNAIYELGVRHALRPYTTVIIAEDGIMKSPFFDLSHIVIRTYRHLGEDIGVTESKRVITELTAALQEIATKKPEERRDSPVYTFLRDLDPPVNRKRNAGGRQAMIEGGGTVAEETGPVYSALINSVDEAQKRGDWLKAKVALEAMRALRKTKLATQTDDGGMGRKAEDPYLLQRLALATYKSKHPTPIDALLQAKELLALLEPHTSNDTETLGLWGSVHKQLWSLTGEVHHLDESVRAYERGFYLRNDYYNGINFAFLLNERAAKSDEKPAEAIADFIQAERVRREVIDICQELLKCSEMKSETEYWVKATLAEAYLGIGDKVSGQNWLDQIKEAAPHDWMKDTTSQQIAKLAILLDKSPLRHLKTVD